MKKTLVAFLFAAMAIYGCSSDDGGDGGAGSGGSAGTGGSAGSGGSAGMGGEGGSGGSAGMGGEGGSGGSAGMGGEGGSGGMVGELLYEQDFESLDQASTTALGDAGFLVFGTEFNADGSVANAYGPFPAPNNPAAAAFSLIAAGEGGPDQGSQQIVIFSDYQNRAAMDAGRVVEALTFQERTLEAADVGTTFTFTFQAKLGDIGGDSTAFAFIKTIDPANSFAQTNLVTVDTTSIPETWGNYEISLDIIPALEGQFFQFGFGATATNDEPSGVFYDNMELTKAPTAP